MKKNLMMIMALAGWLGSAGSHAQTPVSNLVVTVGTTLRTNGTDWSYVLLGSPQSQLLAGKRFDVFAKAGYPTNTGTFSLRASLFQQTDTNAINGLLTQSLALGEDLTALGNALNNLLHNVSHIMDQSVPQKVASAFQVANNDVVTAQVLAWLGHLHPGLMMCEGLAFAEPITGVTTYEVRDVNLATGIPGDVLGRVTITPGVMNLLPAPGTPCQVITNDPSDHLRIRLRWGTPDELRRLSLLSYGFNVWRISSNAYYLGNYANNPPIPQQLHTNQVFTNVNTAPVMASKDYPTNLNNGTGADDPSDRLTYFFSDSNGRARGNPHFPTNRPPQYPTGVAYPPTNYFVPPFNDGDTFYYFVTARDVLGRDGYVSPAGTARAYRRLPPQAPTGLRVQNNYQVLSVNPPVNQQALLLTWQQNLNTNDQVTEYWVCRWPNPAIAHTSDANPSDNRIMVVPQVAGTNNSYLDNGIGAPLTPGLSNYWYTVRAVSQTASGQTLLSPHTPAAWGVLRERFGPDGTTGDVIGSCGTPAVIVQSFQTNTLSGTPDVFNAYYRFTCQRHDHGIAWVQFLATNQFGNVDVLGPLYFDPDLNTVSADYSLVTSNGTLLSPTPGVGCIVGTFYGEVSQLLGTNFAAPSPPGQQQEVVFYAGQLLLTAFSSADPLAAAVGYGQFCTPVSSAKAFGDGTVRLQFYAPTGAMLIQVQTSVLTNTGGYVPLWSDIGVAVPDTNGFYWVSYPACLVQPLPPFRGCLVNLSNDGLCDRHISGGRLDGRRAPIIIRFHLTPRTHEYRLYRRANDGPLTMVAQGAAVYDDPTRYVVVTDNTMPPSAARLCYYVQLLDEHGNGGPMTFLSCKEEKPPKPPRPVLAEPHAIGDINNPQVLLTWFCPTAGVYRFQVDIQTDSIFFSTNTTPLSPAGHGGLRPVYNGLREQRDLTSIFNESRLTPPIGPSYGPGPQFTLAASVGNNVTYNIAVAAQDEQGKMLDHSQVWTFTWKPTNGVPEVPWPARPVPPINAFDDVDPTNIAPSLLPRVEAVLQRSPNFGAANTNNLDSLYPVGIRIGDLSSIPAPTNNITSNIGTTNFAGFAVFNPQTGGVPQPPPPADPNQFLFRRQSTDPTRRDQLLLPIVVYRQQVTNSLFPRVSGNVAQVTPLLEQLAYSATPCTNCPRTTVNIYDRLVAIGSEYDQLNNTNRTFMYLRDQQPVIIGASYQYFVVRLNDQREMSEIIPAGTVTIPNSP